MTDPDQTAEGQLEARIAAAKAARRTPNPIGGALFSGTAGLADGDRMVAGLGIGFGIGYGLDVLFGTLPIFLVLFTCWASRPG